MSLKIIDFAVVVRNIVDLGKPMEPFHEEAILEALKDVVVSESECFSVSKDVAARVCSLAKYDIVRMELPTIEVLDTPNLYFLPDAKIVELYTQGPRYNININLVLHRSGALLINMHQRIYNAEGVDVPKAIENTRVNLRTLAIKIPKKLVRPSRFENNEEKCRCFSSSEGAFLVGSLKDFASDVIRPLLVEHLQNKLDLQAVRDRRCISSSLVEIYRTDPICTSIEEFLKPEKFGKEMFGLGALHKSYVSRSEASVIESFAHNLSNDEESCVFTFVLSDLILFDQSFEQLVAQTLENKHYKDTYAAYIYYTSHYSCLLEWVYLEKYLIDLYNRMLSKTAAQRDTSPEQMLQIQKESMGDLIGYKSGITPYPSREDFLEKARISHRIPEAQEKLEKKRDLATDYVLQEYTLRTNRSIQLVNIFVSASAAFGLMEVILSIQGTSHRAFWAAVTALLFIITLLVLWGINKLFLVLAKKRQ